MVTITTPRPPLNLFEVVRAEIGVEWTTIGDVPYDVEIRASGAA